ncbi:MAG: hypothetical protein IJH50_06855 [Kiritimatiellae bacterium]|nr:hypothetical protein [Kiritimatiellia bacterium]
MGAALCGAAKSPRITIRAMLLEELANAVLDNVHIIYRESIARGNLLRGNLEALAKDKDIEVAARDVLFRLENLKRPGEGFCTGLRIQGDALEPGSKYVFKLLRHELDILGVEIGTVLHVAKE